MEKKEFKNCQKIVVFSKDNSKILLCRKKGENKGVFSFIGRSMEPADSSILDGLKREKDREVGKDFKIRIFPGLSTNVLADGRHVVPHYYAEYHEGDVRLDDEYSDYIWVWLDELKYFEPKIRSIPCVVDKLARLKSIIKEDEFVVI